MMTTTIQHLAIILDGNRRWAKEHNLPSLEGHRRGFERLNQVGDWCFDRGIKIFTVFAFSTENWDRTQEEIGYLMDLFEKGITMYLKHYGDRGIRIRILGRREGLRPSVLRAIEKAESETEKNTVATFCMCLNYGGRTEIVDAVRKIVEEGLKVEDVTEEALTARMYWPEMAPPDLIVRTSGEERLSGFLTWESPYSELYWCQKNWPDFDEAELDTALETFATRERRFGK
jgi:undecaprenyl diphosphate synthase